MTQVSSGRKWGTLAIGCVAALVLAIDITALHLAIPAVIRELDPSATQVLWIADAYGFALAGLLITMGYVGDRIGRRRLLLIGTFGFAAASALTAYANTPELLIAARALLGVAGATIMPTTLSLIRNVFIQPKERTMAVGIFSGMTGAGIGLGPLLGGAMLNHFWWGSVFLINVPLMALVFLAGLIVLPESRNPDPGRLDLVGVPLSMIGVLGVVYAIKEAAAGGVAQTHVLVSLLLGLIALLAFGLRQTRLSHPLIDIRLFARPAFTGSIAVNLIAVFAMIAQSLIFAQYFQLVLGWTPWEAGLAGLPGGFSAVIGGVLTAPLISALGRARTTGLGMAIASVGIALYTLADVDTPYWMFLVAMIPAGFGMGMAMTVTGDTILASVPKQRAGAASAISETATELGGALGMAVLGSVLNAAYRSSITLPDSVPPALVPSIRDSLGGALHAAAQLPASLAAQVVSMAQHSYVDAMHVAAWCSAGLALAAAAAATLTLRSVPKVIDDTPAPAAAPASLAS